MHAIIQLVMYWGLAFVTLVLALVLLNIYFGLIGNDLELRGTGAELVIAGISALIEALSLWLVETYLPFGSRALIFPVVMVALIYRVAHFEDWGAFDVFMLLAFQAGLAFLGVALLFGHFQEAFILLICFGAVLGVIATFAKDLFN